MRTVFMRGLAIGICFSAAGWAQNLTEFGAVAAGSAVGGAGGKPVSNAITAIFGKVDRQAAQPASKETSTETQTAFKRSPAVPQNGSGDVPLPPSEPVRRSSARSLPVAEFTVPQEALRMFSLAEVAPVLAPPPIMTPEDFRGLAKGMTRAEVLRLGAPSAQITMYESGHLIQLYSYRQNGQKFGALRLTDGTVSSLE